MSKEFYSRRGYEFSPHVKQIAKKRSKICEWYFSCDRRHDGTVDHHVSIAISQLMGTPKQFVRSYNNTLLLCMEHNQQKTLMENRFLNAFDQINERETA